MRLTRVHGHSLRRKSFVQDKLKRVSFCVSRPGETQESFIKQLIPFIFFRDGAV